MSYTPGFLQSGSNAVVRLASWMGGVQRSSRAIPIMDGRIETVDDTTVLDVVSANWAAGLTPGSIHSVSCMGKPFNAIGGNLGVIRMVFFGGSDNIPSGGSVTTTCWFEKV